MNDILYRIIRPRMRFLIALFALNTSLNCLAAMEIPSFPENGAVSRLDIRSHGSISQPSQVDEFVRELGKLKSGWRRPLDTFPTPQVTVGLIDSSGGLLCIVWIGPNWLGSKCGLPETSRPLLVPLTVTQASYFRDVVDGKWEVK
jgi:hypothetical protein